MSLGLPNYFEKRVKKWKIAWKKKRVCALTSYLVFKKKGTLWKLLSKPT